MAKLVSVFLMLLCLGSAQEYWELIGFENRDVKCITQHPQDTSIMLISIADSIYRTSDGGYSWSFVEGFWGLPVNCLTFDPIYGDTVYALIGDGSYSDGIYRSTDAGLTWDTLEWFISPLCMTIWQPSCMLIGCDGLGVFKTEDGGNSWMQYNVGLTDLHIYALDYCMPFGDSFHIFFAGTAQGLFVKGWWLEWYQADGIPTDLRVSSIYHDKINALGFAAVTGGSWSDGIYKSTNYGGTWQVVDWWIYPSCVVMNPVWSSPWDTLSVFAADSGLGVKRSTDCGTTWSEINTGLGNLFINAISYHPQDSLRLFATTQSGLYRFVYEPGISEESKSIPVGTINILANILRADEPIFVRCNRIRQGFEISIIDAAGRKVRTDKLTKNTTQLQPLEKSGVYFIVSSEKGFCYKKKIIVID